MFRRAHGACLNGELALLHDPVRGFFDHLLRSEESYAQKWDYVRENPVRAQLVERVEDWPYAGELITIYGD